MHTEIWRHIGRPLFVLALASGIGAVGARTGHALQAATTPDPAAAEAGAITAEAGANATDADTAAAMLDDQSAARERPWPEGQVGDRVSVFGGNRTIEAGEVVRDVLVVGGNLRIRGDVIGDAVVVGGNLTLHEGGRIRGDVVVAGGNFRNRGGDLTGEVRSMRGAAATTANGPSRARTSRSPLTRIWRGFAGLVSTLALGVVLAGVGSVMVFYGFRYLETVSDTLRASTLRSGGIGLAAAFLIVPAFVVLVVALAVSIVGIPVLLLAIPLYPLAIAAAMIFGLIAAAYAIGERTAEQRRPFDMRHRNAYVYLGTGLVVLFAPVMMGHLVGMTPFLGWLGGLIKFFAFAAIWVATIAGFGAVILSRAGTRRTFARSPEPPTDSILDEDPFLERSEV
jgi:hypothetical protein